MTHTRSRTTPLLPPVALTPEEAAAVAVALAAQPDGPFADAGRAALEKVLTALEPDPRRRAELQEAGRRTSAQAGRTPADQASRSRHPAGRGVRPQTAVEAQPEAPQPPRFVLLRGGLA